MRILLIADPQVPIPPRYYGGIERIVALLGDGLTERGHQVNLLAGAGSSAPGGRLFIHHPPSEKWTSRCLRKLWFQLLSLRASEGMDVIINFGRLDYLELLLRSKVPLVCCFQNPIMQREIDYVLSRRRHLGFIGISESQMAGLEPNELIHIVYNAIDVERFRFSSFPADSPYVAFLGRITANKGADIAIDVARRTGMKLKLAGTISNEPDGTEFFEQRIRPQLGGQIEWVGPVDDAAKQELLGGATALLFPIRWPEPFGIVMIESLACGTPVIAMNCASTPEVVRHGETGFLCDTVEEMVKAIERLKAIDRRRCRLDAETRFSGSVMAAKYLAVLNSVMEKANSARFAAN